MCERANCARRARGIFLPARAAFTAENGEFRRLVTRVAMLELVTFGFYRFWLATNIRRYPWSNTSVAGDALEYTGTGRELHIGFLFALAILVPIYLEKAGNTPTGEPLLFLASGGR